MQNTLGAKEICCAETSIMLGIVNIIEEIRAVSLISWLQLLPLQI